MADYGLNRNAEGYADPTAAEAIKGIAKPGEIRKYKGREVLIVKNQAGYCNILTLSPNPGKGNATIEVAGRYTTPGKLNYAFNQDLAKKIEQISGAEFKNVLSEIESCFNITLYSDVVPPPPKSFKEVAELKTENRKLKKRLEILRGMYDELLNRFLNKESEYV